MEPHKGGFEPRLGRSVSIDHAARLLKVSRRTIYNRIREGRLQTIRTIGGSQRVLLSSLYDLGLSRDADVGPHDTATMLPDAPEGSDARVRVMA